MNIHAHAACTASFTFSSCWFLENANGWVSVQQSMAKPGFWRGFDNECELQRVRKSQAMARDDKWRRCCLAHVRPAPTSRTTHVGLGRHGWLPFWVWSQPCAASQSRGAWDLYQLDKCMSWIPHGALTTFTHPFSPPTLSTLATPCALATFTTPFPPSPPLAPSPHSPTLSTLTTTCHPRLVPHAAKTLLHQVELVQPCNCNDGRASQGAFALKLKELQVFATTAPCSLWPYIDWFGPWQGRGNPYWMPLLTTAWEQSCCQGHSLTTMEACRMRHEYAHAWVSWQQRRRPWPCLASAVGLRVLHRCGLAPLAKRHWCNRGLGFPLLHAEQLAAVPRVMTTMHSGLWTDKKLLGYRQIMQQDNNYNNAQSNQSISGQILVPTRVSQLHWEVMLSWKKELRALQTFKNLKVGDVRLTMVHLSNLLPDCDHDVPPNWSEEGIWPWIDWDCSACGARAESWSFSRELPNWCSLWSERSWKVHQFQEFGMAMI